MEQKRYVVRKIIFDYSKMDDCGNFPRIYITKNLEEKNDPKLNEIVCETEEEANKIIEEIEKINPSYPSYETHIAYEKIIWMVK